MSWLDIVTVVLAAWGAILATILGVREIMQESRKIKIILEYVEYFEVFQVRIINVGHRPITIAEIGLAIPEYGKRKKWYPVPSNILMDTNDEDFKPLPIAIDDGKQIVIRLSRTINSELLEKTMDIRLFVYDIEGKVYKKFTKMHYDPKWGQYYPAK